MNGPQAKAYADDFIAVHLCEMPYKGCTPRSSAASMAPPNNATLAAEVQTVFRGTTLRGLLLEAYAFSEMGQIALVAAICSFVLGGIMLVLSGLGFWHLRRVDPGRGGVQQPGGYGCPGHGLTPDQLPRIVSERQPPQAPVPDSIVTIVDWTPRPAPTTRSCAGRSRRAASLSSSCGSSPMRRSSGR